MKKGFSLIELSIVILIIGIMIAGVTQSSRLIKAFRLNTAQTLTQSSPVASIKDLALWLETTSEKSFVVAEAEEGKNVNSWSEINPQVVTKSTLVSSTDKSIYRETGMNGIPALEFVVGETYFTVTMNNFVPGDKKTIFVVFNLTNASNGDMHYLLDNADTNHSVLVDGNGALTFRGSADIVTADNTIKTKTTYVVTAVGNAANSILRYNTSQVTGNASLGTLGNTIRIGAPTYVTAGGCSGSPDCFRGMLGEVIIFDRVLKTEERRAVETYLGKKWGVKI